MKAIVPLNLISDTTISTNLAAGTVHAAYNAGTSYTAGQSVKYNGAYYHCIVNVPIAGTAPIAANNAYWTLMYWANEYAMFDGSIENKSSRANDIEGTITPAAAYKVTSLCFLGMDADTLRVGIRNVAVTPQYLDDDTTTTIGKNVALWTDEGSAILTNVGADIRVENGATAYGKALRVIDVVVGKTYQFDLTILGRNNAATVVCFLGTSADEDAYAFMNKTGTGTVSAVFKATTTTLYIRLIAGSNTAGNYTDFSNIQISECYAFFEKTDLTEDSRLVSTYGTDTVNTGYQIKNVYHLDLAEPISNAVIYFKLEKSGSTVTCGTVVAGQSVNFGVTYYGTNMSLRTYDTKDDSPYFDGPLITQRKFEQSLNYNIGVPVESYYRFKYMVDALRGVPTIWYGREDKEETIIYGYPESLGIAFQNLARYGATLTVKEFRSAAFVPITFPFGGI